MFVLILYKKNYLNQGAVETVRKLALNNPELCAWSGGIKLLINSIIDP